MSSGNKHTPDEEHTTQEVDQQLEAIDLHHLQQNSPRPVLTSFQSIQTPKLYADEGGNALVRKKAHHDPSESTVERGGALTTAFSFRSFGSKPGDLTPAS